MLSRAIGEQRISFLVTVPAVCTLLLRRSYLDGADLSSVRWLGYGGAPIPSTLVHALLEAFPGASLSTAR